jgi:hypothetical protein
MLFEWGGQAKRRPGRTGRPGRDEQGALVAEDPDVAAALL